MRQIIEEVIFDSVTHSWELLQSFLSVCPDDIWLETIGGYPVWQHIAHAVMVADIFVCREGQELAPFPGELTMETLFLEHIGKNPITKDQLKEYAIKVKSHIDEMYNSLSDEDLVKKNVALSEKLGRDCSLGGTLILLARHSGYHLGACDSALRNHGLPGVY